MDSFCATTAVVPRGRGVVDICLISHSTCREAALSLPRLTTGCICSSFSLSILSGKEERRPLGEHLRSRALRGAARHRELLRFYTREYNLSRRRATSRAPDQLSNHATSLDRESIRRRGGGGEGDPGEQLSLSRASNIFSQPCDKSRERVTV